jgi:hypothetical protein
LTWSARRNTMIGLHLGGSAIANCYRHRSRLGSASIGW